VSDLTVELAQPDATERPANPIVRAARWAWTTRPSTIAVLSLVSGLIASSVVLVASAQVTRDAWSQIFHDPWATIRTTFDFLGTAYAALARGAVGSPKAIGTSLTSAVPLVIGGIGLSLAFRAGVFNIGGRSQLVGGAVLASWVGFGIHGLPAPLHVALGLAAALVGGALAGLIPGLIRALTGASEVIVTIMMNYVAANLLVYLLTSTFFRNSRAGSTAPTGRVTLPSARLPKLFDNHIGIDLGLVVAVIVVAASVVFLNRSRLGFELQMAGAGRGAAAVAGLREGRTYIIALVLSGAVVGLAGGVQVLGVSTQLQSNFGGDLGALVLVVALVGRSTPGGVVFAALLYGALQSGGLQMQLDANVSYQLVGVFQSTIVLFITAPALVAAIYRLRQGGPASELFTTSMSAGWGS